MTTGSLFAAAEGCLTATEPEAKVARTHAASAAWREGKLAWDLDNRARGDLVCGRPARPRLVPPRAVARRKLTTTEGRRALVHALTHIEFNAIGLAWDCVWRFRGLPRAFYDDWVSVADDEARHFTILRARLRELGADYGDLDAHDGLWEMANKTAGDLAARLAMVPRVLEARALDVTPGMIDRLRRAGDHTSADILAVILEDEVAHVAAGTRWFRYVCAERGIDPDETFVELKRRYWTGNPPRPVNREYRKRAGFSESELA